MTFPEIIGACAYSFLAGVTFVTLLFGANRWPLCLAGSALWPLAWTYAVWKAYA